MSDYKELAKQGEEKRKAAFQEESTSRMVELLLDAQKDFQDAFDLAQNLPDDDQRKQWIEAHLGATCQSLAHFYSDEPTRREYLNLAKRHLLKAVGLSWSPGQLLEEHSAWGEQGSAWAYAHLGELFKDVAILQGGSEETQNFQNAIAAFDKAIEKSPTFYGWAHSHLGLAYRHRAMSASRQAGDNDEARKNFELVFNKEEKNYWNALYLGATYRALGWKSEQEMDELTDLDDLKKAYRSLQRGLQFFEWVADANSHLLVQMETMQPIPRVIEHLFPPGTLEHLGVQPSASVSTSDLRKEFLQNGPTPEVRKKIDAYYESLRSKP